MNEASVKSRVARLGQALQEAGVDAFLACSPTTMRYLQGFGEDAHERFLTFAVNTRGEARLICPALSADQARRAGVYDVRPWRDGEDPLELFKELADDWGLRTGILAVDNMMPAAILLQMQSVLPAALFKPGQDTLARLMRFKDAEELDKMRTAARIADEALQAALSALKPGVSEREVAHALEEAMRQGGGEPSFSIVATGPYGAEPHHMSDGTLIKESDVVVVDFGCTYEGYQSDITRMACCGKADPEAQKVYGVVLQAHMAARAAIRPGVTGAEVDAAARRVIEDAGYGEFFIHRTGHGIGMHTHEEPYIVNTNHEPLGVGDCFSIEPGVYLPGRFGVRIENIVTVTPEGHESLNAEPAAELIEV